MVSKVCWQLANKWVLSLTTVCLNRWVCCVLGNVSLNVGESKCSSSGRRSLARRGPSVVFSTGPWLFFISVWNILPIWWKLEHCRKQMFPCILTAKNKFLFFEGASPCLFFLGENFNAKDPADASWARMDQGKSPIWARTSPSLRAPGFPLFFGLLSFSSPYPPTKKWK